MNRPLVCAALLAAALPLAPAQAQSMPPADALSAPADGQAKSNQIIATFYYSNSTQGFDADGHTIDIPDYGKTELYVLAEIPVDERLTLLLKPSLRDVSVEGAEGSSGLGYTDVGARYRMTGDESRWLAAEATVRIPGVSRRDNLAQVGGTDVEYDLRLHGFSNIAFGDRYGFVDGQFSYRLRGGDPPNEYHADLSFGFRPEDDLLLLAQSFNTISDGAGRGVFSSYRYHNLQLSAVKNVTPSLALQAGVLGTITGKNALRERGFLAGLWYRF